MTKRPLRPPLSLHSSEHAAASTRPSTVLRTQLPEPPLTKPRARLHSASSKPHRASNEHLQRTATAGPGPGGAGQEEDTRTSQAPTRHRRRAESPRAQPRSRKRSSTPTAGPSPGTPLSTRDHKRPGRRQQAACNRAPRGSARRRCPEGAHAGAGTGCTSDSCRSSDCGPPLAGRGPRAAMPG